MGALAVLGAIASVIDKPENDDPSILDRAAEPVDWQAPLGLVTNRGPNTDADERGTTPLRLCCFHRLNRRGLKQIPLTKPILDPSHLVLLSAVWTIDASQFQAL